MNLKFINTIEIEPSSFSKNSYDIPNGTAHELPQEWYLYWKKSIGDSGLTALEPISKGSWLVDIESISQEDLEKIILTDALEEPFISFFGGVVIKVNNEIIIEPSCCGDLSDLSGWEELVEKESNVWHQLWIGHPWIFYRKLASTIQISDYYECNVNDIDEMVVKCELPLEEVYKQLQVMRRVQNDFEVKIQTLLESLCVSNVREVAKIVSGNEL